MGATSTMSVTPSWDRIDVSVARTYPGLRPSVATMTSTRGAGRVVATSTVGAVLAAPSFLHTRAVYAWMAFALPPAAIFLHALAPGAQVWKGHDLGVLGSMALTLTVVAMWIPFRSGARMTPLAASFLIVTGLAWLIAVLRIQSDGSLFNLGAFAVPVLLLALGSKPPALADLRIAGLVLAYGIAAEALLSIPLGALGVMPNGFDASDSAVCRTPIICDLTGGLDRWAGPFGSVNYAAPAGGLLIVFGLTERRHRWPLVAAGIVVLGLSQGRSALFAVLVAAIVFVLWGPRVSASAHRAAIRATAIALSVCLVGAYIVVVDPTFNGRTGIWSDYLTLWHGAPLLGVGDSGVTAYIEGRAGQITFSHAHSVLFDTLVRWGLISALLALAIYGLALASTSSRLRQAGPGPLAMTSFVIAAGLTETIHGWVYWSVYVAVLTWAVLSAQARSVPVAARPPSQS